MKGQVDLTKHYSMEGLGLTYSHPTPSSTPACSLGKKLYWVGCFAWPPWKVLSSLPRSFPESSSPWVCFPVCVLLCSLRKSYSCLLPNWISLSWGQIQMEPFLASALPLGVKGLWVREVAEAASTAGLHTARSEVPLLTSSLRAETPQQRRHWVLFLKTTQSSLTRGMYIPPINISLTVFFSKPEPSVYFAKEPWPTTQAWLMSWVTVSAVSSFTLVIWVQL